MNKQKILTIFLSVTSILAAFFLWFSVERAITVSYSSTWIFPIVCLSIFVVSACLEMMIFKDILLLELILGISFLTSLIFATHLYQLGAIFFGAYFLFLASRKIRRDMELNVEISIWKSLQAGKSYLLLALVVVISMQYFLTVGQMDGKVGVPKLDLTPMVKKIVLPFLSTLNPAMKNASNETLTVDEFIVLTQSENFQNNQDALSDEILDSQLPQGISIEERGILRNQIRENISKSQSQVDQKTKDMIIQSFHEQLSEISGRPIDGSEKISDVYAALVAEKIDKFLQYPINVGGEKTTAYPIILTLVLILTIYPAGSMLSIIWFLIIKILFWILVKLRVVNVEKIAVQKEILA